jgi:hypothetical protein
LEILFDWDFDASECKDGLLQSMERGVGRMSGHFATAQGAKIGLPFLSFLVVLDHMTFYSLYLRVGTM